MKLLKYNSKFVFKILNLVIIIILLILFCTLLKNYLINSVSKNYTNKWIIRDLLEKDEIEEMQKCTDKNTDINTECYKKLHNTFIEKLKKSLKLKYFSVHHARFSNNNNNDGQTYHRDVKPSFSYDGKDAPNVHTVILYLDEAIIHVGSDEFYFKPGDAVIFNSLYLHKAGDISLIKNKNRRVLQLFCCFFDKDEEERFFETNNSYIFDRGGNDEIYYYIKKYLYYYIDVRWPLEMSNISHELIKYTSKNKYAENKNDCKFLIPVNENFYISTVEGTKYYRDL